jgi:DNA-binding NtrC family response regulator
MNEKYIMIVDDDKNTRRLVEDILTKTRRYKVIQAANGEACLHKLENEIVDLVLLDLQMPGIDGIETLKRIRRQFHDLPVVIMTAHGTIDRAVSSMKLGSYDFLSKPFPAERLRVTVKNALETSELESEVKSLRSELKDRYQIDNILCRTENHR